MVVCREKRLAAAFEGGEATASSGSGEHEHYFWPLFLRNFPSKRPLLGSGKGFSELSKKFYIDKVRFANSGTEAVMGAIRTARGYTKRNRIAFVEGAFHGLFDEVMWTTAVVR